MDRVLVVVSEEERLEAVERLLLDRDVRLAVARTLTGGIAEIGQVNPDLVILALPLPGVTVVQALTACRGEDPRLPVVIHTAGDSTREAIETTKVGAFDYLLEPCARRSSSTSSTRWSRPTADPCSWARSGTWRRRCSLSCRARWRVSRPTLLAKMAKLGLR